MKNVFINNTEMYGGSTLIFNVISGKVLMQVETLKGMTWKAKKVKDKLGQFSPLLTEL